MRNKKILGVFLFLSIILWTFAPSHASTQAASTGEVSKQPTETQTKNETQSPAPKIKAVDKAGENIGKGIDKFSRSASSKIGKWI